MDVSPGEFATTVERDGVVVTTTVSDSTRYHAMANDAGTYEPGMRIETPIVDFAADTVLPESLTTSIQPHFQVAHAPTCPYFRYALRVAGPPVALGVNSPFFPAELYATDDRGGAGRPWMENRVPVLEGCNPPPPPATPRTKCASPRT